VIEFRSLTVAFGADVVLRDVTLTLDAGRTHVLIGPSGCGKSTLLRLLTGLLRPTRGEVRLAGRALAPDTQAEINRGLGYVIQEGGLFPHLAAGANAILAASLAGVPPAAARARGEELFGLLGLGANLWNRFPAQLSGGQRQRVALARALMLDPAVLLLDEPLGAVDPMARAELQGELRELFRRLRKTVVFVTHDLAEAAFLGDSVTLLGEGTVAQHGPFRALLDAPASDFVARFVRSQRALHNLEA
jgi:osmoprotectant transport system ATP-binding protein